MNSRWVAPSRAATNYVTNATNDQHFDHLEVMLNL